VTRAVAERVFVALVHYPVLDKSQRVIATAVTNLDIHDIARATRTFGLGGYFVVTPIAAQRELVGRILGHWTHGAGRAYNDKRTDALETVRISESLADARVSIENQVGQAPYVVATAAKPPGVVVGYAALRSTMAESPRPVLLCFGTGWGLSGDVLAQSDAVLAPIQGQAEYNHLSVRSAVAIVLDRLFGRPSE
jgi:hypothetical protein